MAPGARDILDVFRAACTDREAEARRRHGAGQKVVGYLSCNVPVELIAASGAFPVQLFGIPGAETPLADLYMEDFFDGRIRSLFQRILAGDFDFIDLLVIPRSSEGLLQLYYFLQEVARIDPAVRLPPLYMFDLLQTEGELTRGYVQGRLEDMQAALARLNARAITPEALRGAIRDANRRRALQQAANRLRREASPRLSGGDALCLALAATVMDQEAYCGQLQGVPHAEGLAGRQGARIMLKGMAQDDAGLTDLVEACGATVVADDHPAGERTYEALVPETDDPLAALAVFYQRHSPGPRLFPQARQDAIFLDLVKAAQVQGVIFHVEEHDDTLGWDYPAQKAALDRLGIPSLYLVKQSWRHPDRVAQRHAVQAFVRQLRGGGA
jgi:benzoyl-CoA reductase/2-hydroxyglutaryl-CoA dehydratase subunit BcrC/BadD/HgdB